jgi:hypothetical protein
VLEVRERAQAHLDHLVRGVVVEPGDEGDAAGVVLVPGVVEACGLRLSGRHLEVLHRTAGHREAERRW